LLCAQREDLFLKYSLKYAPVFLKLQCENEIKNKINCDLEVLGTLDLFVQIKPYFKKERASKPSLFRKRYSIRAGINCGK
jgi:hypothetical protein